jgi:hypothetical protein
MYEQDRWVEVWRQKWVIKDPKEIVIFERPDGTRYMEGETFRIGVTENTMYKLNGFELADRRK